MLIVEEMKKGQVECLMFLVQEMFVDYGVVMQDLDVIGVGVGLGNFIGICIFVLVVCGMVLGFGIFVVGVLGFEVWVYGYFCFVMVVIFVLCDQFYV